MVHTGYPMHRPSSSRTTDTMSMSFFVTIPNSRPTSSSLGSHPPTIIESPYHSMYHSFTSYRALLPYHLTANAQNSIRPPLIHPCIPPPAIVPRSVPGRHVIAKLDRSLCCCRHCTPRIAVGSTSSGIGPGGDVRCMGESGRRIT